MPNNYRHRHAIHIVTPYGQAKEKLFHSVVFYDSSFNVTHSHRSTSPSALWSLCILKLFKRCNLIQLNKVYITTTVYQLSTNLFYREVGHNKLKSPHAVNLI